MDHLPEVQPVNPSSKPPLTTSDCANVVPTSRASAAKRASMTGGGGVVSTRASEQTIQRVSHGQQHDHMRMPSQSGKRLSDESQQSSTRRCDRGYAAGKGASEREQLRCRQPDLFA